MSGHFLANVSNFTNEKEQLKKPNVIQFKIPTKTMESAPWANIQRVNQIISHMKVCLQVFTGEYNWICEKK